MTSTVKEEEQGAKRRDRGGSKKNCYILWTPVKVRQ